jgi:hypothetical protein
MPAASRRFIVSIAVARDMPDRSAMVAADRHTGRSASPVDMESAITTRTIRAVASRWQDMIAEMRS